MAKIVAISLVIAMLVIVACGLFCEAASTRIIVNRQELTGPSRARGAAGLIAVYCAAIFLLFVFAGISSFTGCRDIRRTYSGGIGVPAPAYSAVAIGYCLVVHCDRTENCGLNV